jgi:CRISPR-associated endonuclease/helicase Cas3
MAPSIYDFWAKTGDATGSAPPSYHLLPYHNLDVAAVAQVLLDSDDLLQKRLADTLNLPRASTLPLLVFLIAMHDAGKFAEGFQYLAPDLFAKLRGRSGSDRYTVRHDTLGFVAWQNIIWPVVWEEDWFGLHAHTGTGKLAQAGAGEYFTALMKAVAGHHGAPPELNHRAQHADVHFDDDVQSAVLDFARRCCLLLLPDSAFQDWNYKDDVPRAKRASWLLAGLTVMADWIGSNQDYFSFRQEEIPLKRYWREHALPQARDALSKTGVLPSSAVGETGLQVLFPDLFSKHDPTPLQRHAATCALGDGPQLFMLEDLTGAGKTEAALTLTHRLMDAGRAAGQYVGLPTTATADAMYERVGAAYERLYEKPGSASLTLAHSAREHSSAFQQSIEMDDPRATTGDTYDGDERTGAARCTAWLADSRQTALLASVGVGTIDQALISILPARHQSLRLAGLSRNVLVVDEVHACDAYMLRLLERLLAFHAAQGGSAILLSATLPMKMRQQLADAFRSGLQMDPLPLGEEAFPLATHVGAYGKAEQPLSSKPGAGRDIRVKPFHEKSKVAGHLTGKAEDGRCGCWIRNTVGDAVKAYRMLRQRLGPERVDLFHARFALCDRQTIETRVLDHFGKDSGPEDRNGKIVIATQVIEQSLDLDFDAMVTDLTFIDLIIQRVGRMLRHLRDAEGNVILDGPDEREDPALGVLMPPLADDPNTDWYKRLFPSGAYVYPEVDALWRTAQVLLDHGSLKLPEEARELIESVYGDGAAPVPEPISRAAQEAKSQTRINESLAASNALTLNKGYGNTADRAHWQSDERTPTRLGEETTTVRLGRRRNGRIEPWADEGKGHPWARSELNVRAAKINGEANLQVDGSAVGNAKEAMPDGGEWSVLVALDGPTKNEQGESVWTGAARNADGERMHVTYSAETGLRAQPAQ